MTRKSPGRPFPKGVSGNPKGRPRTGLAIAEMAREEIDKYDLVAKLGLIAARGRGDRQIKAITLLLHYAFGTPPSQLSLQHSGAIGGAESTETGSAGEIIEARLAKILERRRAEEAHAAAASTAPARLALVGEGESA